MSHFEVKELRSAVDALTLETARLNQAAAALLQKFVALDGLAYSEFDRSLTITAGWTVLTDTISAAGLQIQEQAHQLQRAGARQLEPFDDARQQEADTDIAARDRRATAYASAETDNQAEADTLRHRFRTGENLSAFERSRAQDLGVLLPPLEKPILF